MARKKKRPSPENRCERSSQQVEEASSEEESGSFAPSTGETLTEDKRCEKHRCQRRAVHTIVTEDPEGEEPNYFWACKEHSGSKTFKGQKVIEEFNELTSEIEVSGEESSAESSIFGTVSEDGEPTPTTTETTLSKQICDYLDCTEWANYEVQFRKHSNRRNAN